MKTIPAGYQLQITSWENDGDNYNTKTLNGLTLDEAASYAKLAKFVGVNFGNTCGRSEINLNEFATGASEIANLYPNVSLMACILEAKDQEEVLDIVSDWAYDVLGSSEWYVFRVFEYYECYYFPEVVKAVTLDI